MKTSELGIRPLRVAIAASAGVLLVMSCTAARVMVYHLAIVWVNGGIWCVRLSPNGQQEVLYGKSCSATHSEGRGVPFQLSKRRTAPLQ